ncbi:MAG: hypothetical protein EKK41_05545 [Hyphomicrobiales bacterium]|nr:MAG: hypothetical protein EKK41_05545 [Hyphomicrobiales bacterium]
MSDTPDAGSNGLTAAAPPTKVAAKGSAAAARRERQAAQLRANLARRKQQAREKARLSAGSDPAPGD